MVDVGGEGSTGFEVAEAVSEVEELEFLIWKQAVASEQSGGCFFFFVEFVVDCALG